MAVQPGFGGRPAHSHSFPLHCHSSDKDDKDGIEPASVRHHRSERLSRPSVASPIICRSALAIEAHRGVASLANTLGMGCALRLALRSDGCAQPTTSDP
ncbi:hypothetical protein [Verminephrobacter eiseniae]|uniref:hypothetical protein n=1 Tax=Verminephrobacter eiseniae TaxID=364317 RepID=UPI0012ED6645|nr:hypothetical protein [Verminephrobacter eiseniae]